MGYNTSMRCFFGMGIDHHLALELVGLRDRAVRELAGAEPRPVPAGNFHVTLAFLGDLPAERLPLLQDCASAMLADVRPGQIRFREAHCFPDARSRVFALEGEPDDEALHLYRHLCQCIATAGFPVEHRDFRPHITLVRLRHSFVPAPRWPLEASLSVRELCLYESVPRASGTRYRIINRWELPEAADS